jgi:hypothetical protein
VEARARVRVMLLSLIILFAVVCDVKMMLLLW